MATLQERGRKLYVVHSSAKWDEPVMVHSWYSLDFAIVHGMMARWKPVIGQTLHEYGPRGGGSYVGDLDGKRYQLPQGGQTKPEFTETEPVPPPPRARTTRYRCGHWEKYTKARGWHRA